MRKRTALLGLCAVLAIAPACQDDAPPAPPAAPQPVPAPPGLLAELVIARPDRALGQVREAAGGPMLLLPRTVGGVLVNVLGLPLTVVDLFDEQLPVVGALAEGADGEPLMALAAHVRGAEGLVARITSGAGAPFRVDKDSELRWLRPTPNARPASVAGSVALVDHFVVLASSDAAARALGPYLARTLGPRKAPAGDALMTLEVRDGVWTSKLVGRVAALVRDLELPEVVRPLLDLEDAAKGALAELENLGGGQVTVTLDDTALRVVASLVPRDAQAAKRLAALPTVSPRPMASLPDDAQAALTWIETKAGRELRAGERAGQLKAALLGELSDEQLAAVSASFAALAQGRGDRTTLALRCTGAGLTGMAQGEVVDKVKLLEALGDLVALRKLDAIQAKLDEQGFELGVKETRLERVPFDVWRLRLAPKKKADSEREPIDFVYAVTDKTFYAAAGMETVTSMQRLAAPDLEASLGSRAAMKDALGRAPDPAWATAIVDPQGLFACLAGKPGGRFATPVVLAAAPAKQGAMVHLEVSRPLLRLAGKQLGP